MGGAAAVSWLHTRVARQLSVQRSRGAACLLFLHVASPRAPKALGGPIVFRVLHDVSAPASVMACTAGDGGLAPS